MLISAKKLPTAWRYVIGAGLSLFALALQLGVAAIVGTRIPFLLFIPLVALAAALLGSGPAAIVLSTGFLYGCSIFLAPDNVGGLRDQLSLGLFVVVGVFFIYVGGKVRAVAGRALDAEVALLNEKLARERADDERLRQLYQQVRSSEERYRTLFDSMDQGFCVIDVLFDDAGVAVDYRVLEMNPMFGIAIYRPGRRRRQDHRARLVPRLGSLLVRHLRPGRAHRASRCASRTRRRRAGAGSTSTPPASAAPDSRKRGAAVHATSRARKQTEEDLRRLAADLAEADRRKTEFLATLAHELRNPLAPIRSGLDLHAPERRQSGRRSAQVRDMMERQVGHMVHLVDDLLDIARISGGKLELKQRARRPAQRCWRAPSKPACR